MDILFTKLYLLGMDICNKKNQINDLLQDVFSDYNTMRESKIQESITLNQEMKKMSSTISSLENSERDKEEEIRVFRKTIHDYEKLINDLQEKFEIAEEDKKEENKFDMLRIQAKEISEKGREIDRLNGLLNHYKNKDNKIKDNKIKDNKIEDNKIEDNKIEEVMALVVDGALVSNALIEITDPITGEDNPNFIYSGIIESEPSPEGSIHDEQELKEEPELKELELNKGKLLKVTAKGIKYFVYENENPQKLYAFNEEKKTDDIVGNRTKNEKGKYKVQLFTS